MTRCSSFRLSISFTGAFASLRETRADHDLGVEAQLAAEASAHVVGDDAHVGLRNLQRTGDAVARPCTACVETHAVSLSPSHSQMPPCVSRLVCVWTCVE